MRVCNTCGVEIPNQNKSGCCLACYKKGHCMICGVRTAEKVWRCEGCLKVIDFMKSLHRSRLQDFTEQERAEKIPLLCERASARVPLFD